MCRLSELSPLSGQATLSPGFLLAVVSMSLCSFIRLAIAKGTMPYKQKPRLAGRAIAMRMRFFRAQCPGDYYPDF